jgi:hypothetical protein
MADSGAGDTGPSDAGTAPNITITSTSTPNQITVRWVATASEMGNFTSVGAPGLVTVLNLHISCWGAFGAFLPWTTYATDPRQLPETNHTLQYSYSGAASGNYCDVNVQGLGGIGVERWAAAMVSGAQVTIGHVEAVVPAVLRGSHIDVVGNGQGGFNWRLIFAP